MLHPDTFAHAGRILRADSVIYALVAAYAAATASLFYFSGALAAFTGLHYAPVWIKVFFLLFPFVYGMLGILHVVHRVDKRRALAFRKIFAGKRLAHFGAGIVLLFAMMLFHETVGSIKNALPIWRGGFLYDVAQADLDRLLHFGQDPWRYLYAVAGNGFMRSVIEWNYNQGWFIVCFSALFWIAVSYEARAIRTRYMLCYMLVWIVIGNLFAGVFLSAGPAFYGHVTGDMARFGDQLAFLQGSEGSKHAAVRVQRYLWSLYASGEQGIGSGISAFPSMHVSLVTLNALFLSEVSRRWGLVGFIYVAVIVVSSVYLAWHYAIDGYAAIVLTVTIYAVVRYAMNAISAKAGALEPAKTPWPATDAAV